jgi:hypothetical protein
MSLKEAEFEVAVSIDMPHYSGHLLSLWYLASRILLP